MEPNICSNMEQRPGSFHFSPYTRLAQPKQMKQTTSRHLRGEREKKGPVQVLLKDEGPGPDKQTRQSWHFFMHLHNKNAQPPQKKYVYI